MTKSIWQSLRLPQDIKLARYSGDVPRLQALLAKYQAIHEAKPKKYWDACILILNNCISACRHKDRLARILPSPEMTETVEKRLDQMVNGDRNVQTLLEDWKALNPDLSEVDPATKKTLVAAGFTVPTPKGRKDDEALITSMEWSCKEAIAWLREWRTVMKEDFLALEQCWGNLCDTGCRMNPGRHLQANIWKYPGIEALETRYERWNNLWAKLKAVG